jgi:sterol O-acyltransferase
MLNLKVMNLGDSLFFSGSVRPFIPDELTLMIGLGLLFIQTSLRSWEANRTPLSWKFGKLITGDALVLALADGLMTIGQFFCVPFVKGLIARGYKYYWAGLVIQHTYQTLYLGVAIWIGVHRQWYWVQAGFLVLRKLSSPV